MEDDKTKKHKKKKKKPFKSSVVYANEKRFNYKKTSDEEMVKIKLKFNKQSGDIGDVELFTIPEIPQTDAKRTSIGQKLLALQKELRMEIHTIDIHKLEKKLHTNFEQGLSMAEAKKRLRKNGPNRIVPYSRRFLWKNFKSKSNSFFHLIFYDFTFILLFGGIISVFSETTLSMKIETISYRNIALGIGLIGVVLLKYIFSNIQESRKSSEFKIPKKAMVIRDGRHHMIPCESIVIGDIVFPKVGDIVPADIRIIRCSDFYVDNASVTGSSYSESRSADGTNTNPLKSKNMIFCTTYCTGGSSCGVVVSTGASTIAGKMAKLTFSVKPDESPIAKDIREFLEVSTAISLILGMLFFVTSLSFGYGFLEAFVFCFGIIIANIPEGLLPLMTMSMIVASKKMFSKNVMVNNLQSVGTLGAVTAICSDKTGTLTQNTKTVAHVWFNNQVFAISAANETASNVDYSKMKKTSGWEDLFRICVLCNQSTLQVDQENVPARWFTGDATDCAIIKFADSVEEDILNARVNYPKVYEVPFNSTNKYHITVHQTPEGGYILCAKGAPEKIIISCSTILYNDEEDEIDSNWIDIFELAYLSFGEMGECVLGFADLDLYDFLPNHKFKQEDLPPLRGLRFLGLVALIDPPRPAVPDAIKKCHQAGIRIAMVTGDHPITAKAIARSVGIISPDSETIEDIAIRLKKDITDIDPKFATAAIIRGSDLVKCDIAHIENILKTYKEVVFARTSHQQKLIIVEAFQNCGEIVAITGDDTGDCPAMRKADIGISMGISGNDMSKQSADIILMDDNFASIVSGVEEGRLFFHNLKKSISYILASHIPEMMPFIIFIILETPLFISTFLIIIIDIGIDMLPSISLSKEQKENDLMLEKPRNLQDTRLFNTKVIVYSYGHIGVIIALAAFFSSTFVYMQNGFNIMDLIGVKRIWYSPHAHDVVDRYKQEWSYSQRMSLESSVQSTYFITLVICQIVNVMKTKTLFNSIFTQGMRNMMLNFSILFDIFIAAVVIYSPWMCSNLDIWPAELQHWVLGIPFAILILLSDELRKLIARKCPEGFIHQTTVF